MNTCPIKNVCYGFSSFSPSDILDAGTTNLQISNIISPLNPQSNHKNTHLNKVRYYMPQKFLNESNKSREISENGDKWNEMGYRRFDENGNRIMPDYIVYFSNGDIDQNDIIWTNSINASKQFNVPIVIVNKQKIALYNLQHEMTEFTPRQQVFINNNKLSKTNSDVNYLIESYFVSSKIFQEDEWKAIKERYNYDDLEPEKKRFIEEEYIEFCKRKTATNLFIDNDKIDIIEGGRTK